MAKKEPETEVKKVSDLITPPPSQVRNLYDLLEISPRASPEVISAAYKTLMDIFGPDKPGANERVARALTEAHATLSDPLKREIYDKERKDIKGKIVGEFRVLEFIAEGAVGKTYKGEHIFTGMPVCIKHCFKVSPELEEIFIQETKAMWDLRHYSIPAVRGLEKLDDGSVALIMSYIPGLTLKQIIEKLGHGLEAEHVAWIAERILNALKYMHYNGVVHGDIKPHNIIIEDKTHTIVIVDFGLSMVKPASQSDNKGYTLLYSASEQIAGSVLVPESDFYSLGMTMIYALGGNDKAVERKEVPEDTPDALCKFIKRLIVRDVLSRPRWEKEDLCETIREVRKESFGRVTSGMKPIPGL